MHRILLAIAFILSSSVLLIAQETISLELEQVTLAEALQEVKRQADIRLAYDARNLREVRVNVRFSSLPLPQALDSLLAPTAYEPLLLKDTWLIIPKEDRTPRSGEELRRRFSVSGRLVDGQTGAALPYANVSLMGARGGTITNVDGYFNISEVPIDTIPLCFSYVGYRTKCLDLAEHSTENMFIRLDPANTFLLAVDVIGNQMSSVSINSTEDLIKLDSRSFIRNASTAHSDVFQSIQFLPGVSSGDILDSQLHIRGGEEDENLVLWDGFTLYHLDHFFGVFSTFNPAVIQDINLRKGPYKSRFGGRSGGVLEVTGRTGDRSSSRTSIHTDLIDTGLLTEGPVGDHSSYLISFRRSHTDFIRSGIFSELLDRLFTQSVVTDSDDLVASTVESEFDYHDLNVKWHTDIDTENGLDFSLFNGGDRFERASRYTYEEEGTPFQYNDLWDDRSEWGNIGMGLRWSRQPDPTRSVITSLGFSEYHSRYYFLDRQRDFLNGIPLVRRSTFDESRNRLTDVTFSHLRSLDLDDGGEVEYGYQFTFQEVEQTYTDRRFSTNTIRLEDSSDVARTHALHLDRTWVPLTDWSLRAGGRLSYNDYSGNLYLEPRIRVEYRLDPRMSFSLASGNYIQPIRRVAEQNLFLRQPDRWRLSDGDLLPESRSFHTSLGMHYEHKRFQASVEGYYKRLKGVVLNQEQNRLLSAFTVENEQLSIGKGEVIGADLMVNYEQGAHSAWLAYSYTYSANVFEDIDDGDPMPSTYNKPHDIKMVYDYRYRDYTFHSQWTASTGYPYTPVLGVFEGPGGDPFLVYGEELSARLPDQFRWDISLSRHFSLRDMDLHLGAGIFNLTDHRNIRTRTYSTNQVRDEAPEELRINTIDLELIGLSPTFSLRLDFR